MMRTSRSEYLFTLIKRWMADCIATFNRIWALYHNKVYDLTDYVNTQDVYDNQSPYNFLDDDIVSAFKKGVVEISRNS